MRFETFLAYMDDIARELDDRRHYSSAVKALSEAIKITNQNWREVMSPEARVKRRSLWAYLKG